MRDIDAAVFTNRALGGVLARPFVSDVAGETEMALAEVARGVSRLTFIEVQNDDTRTLLGEEARGPTANSTRGCGSRDDADLIG
jgi:hypothetical protein